jgi:hypothetical protein
MSALGPLIPIPKKLIKDPARIAEYESLEKDPVALLAKFKWWSLHDLMTEFHDGLMPKENNANYLKFEIDLSADELKRSTITDPSLKSNVDRAMTPGLQNIATATQALITDIKVQGANQMAQNVTGALRPQVIQAAPIAAPVVPGAPVVAGEPAEVIDPIPYSAANLEKECLKDLLGLVLTSKERIFVTDGVLPSSPQLGGLIKMRKTRKGRKHGQRKPKTRRHRRKVPLKKVQPNHTAVF